MRHDEIRRFDDVVAVQNQIQVEGPRRTRVGPLAAKSLLDVEQRDEQISRGQASSPPPPPRSESRLFADADRRRVVKARRPQRVDEGAQRFERGAQIAVAIAEIAPECDGDRGNGLYSCQRVGRTAPTRSAPAVRRPMTSSRPEAACSNRR